MKLKSLFASWIGLVPLVYTQFLSNATAVSFRRSVLWKRYSSLNLAGLTMIWIRPLVLIYSRDDPRDYILMTYTSSDRLLLGFNFCAKRVANQRPHVNPWRAASSNKMKFPGPMNYLLLPRDVFSTRRNKRFFIQSSTVLNVDYCLSQLQVHWQKVLMGKILREELRTFLIR